MSEDWIKVTLGDIVTMTKGSTATQKAIPGKYPLVVTAAEFLSSDHYQFEGEAVCVPMVSSTGHGHASLKRVHYASGKFAVANIITALQKRNDAPVDMKYLHLLLDHQRDSIIVPLMKGTANVSLSQRSLAGAIVSLPPVEEQHRIVDLIGAVDDATAAAEANHREGLVAGAQVVGEAMLAGDPDMGILDDVAKWYSGATPKAGKPEFYEGGTIPWAVIADVQDKPISGTAKSLTEAGAAVVGRKAPVGSVLVSMYGTIGRSAIVTTEMTTNQAIAWGVPKAGHTGEFIFAWIRLNRVKLDALGRGATQRNINRAMLREFPIPLVSEAREQELMELSDAVDAVVQASESTVTRLRGLRSNLLTALLSGEHVIPESYDELLEVSA
ncbi:restriction endonuclease subunit S [Micrococcus sp. 116]|uniref:restriction endonuclease subunit S n=1 Tax=Micrococcus sp. 116 TaxID=2653154 RepID=UPI0012F1AF20|nr:restriction endonuclease subunit S [Micrococcus sp. 116]VWX45458.1 Type I restriction modification DNA specificity domain-containing protein [Micrococcus sp. 116]